MARTKTSIPHTYHPAAKDSYDSSRLPIKMIVVHTMVGTLNGTIGWFKKENRANPSSAHYGVGYDGTLVRFVDENKTAYHAGNYSANQLSCGVEFEDKKRPNDPRPDALYQTGASLIRDICDYYKLPINRDTIKKHRDVKDGVTECPGTLDVERLIALAKGEPMEEPLKKYEMKESKFLEIIAKSSNFDRVAEFLNLSLDARRDPKAGELIVNSIREIQRQAADLILKQDELMAKLQAKPEENKGVLDKILPRTTPEPPSTPLVPMPAGLSIETATVQRGKRAILNDVKKLIKQLTSWFWT